VPEDNRPEDYRIDKRRMRSSFDRAAAGYEQVAVLQREIGERLLERLELVRLVPETLLDLGAGTGEVTERLARRYPRARLVALDLSLAMLRGARRRSPRLARWRGRRAYLCADAERLPLADGCLDMAVSNLMLQWCNDLDAALGELRRVLRPDGLLMFTSFGPDTLKELRASWAGVDGYSHVNAFIDMHDVGDALMRAGFSEPVMDREDIRLTYRNLPALMRDLKALGAHNATAGRPRGLTGPRRLARVTAAYEAWRVEGRLPATYEVVYGHCWAGTVRGKGRGGAGEVHVPLSRLARPEGGR
jgi:malonyl-CoA O-methyltransferase